eukprot:1156657-Pelagomonas_calceolata.AAC.6
MITKRHNIASRILLKGISKGPLGTGLASMDIGRADRLALQNLQTPEHSTNRSLLKHIFPHCFPDKTRLSYSRPDAKFMKRVRMTNSQYPLRSRGGRRGNKRKDYASQVQLRALRKGPPTSKLARASPRRFTGPA